MFRLPAILSCAVVLGGCNEECNRDGCDALTKHASSGVVAGVVASESDVVSNDCQECTFAQARVRAWPVDSAAQTDAELRAVVMGAPSASAESGANGRYRLDDLPSGALLVCVGSSSCFNVDALGPGTTTLNVKLIDGISSGFVGASGQALERVDALMLPPGALLTENE